jgi:replicative DNA helicase Mcm
LSITPIDDSIKSLSTDNNLIDKLVGSLSPSLYGMRKIKQGVLYQLVGGNTKLNLLLVGDPGTGKSHLLTKAAQLNKSRVVYPYQVEYELNSLYVERLELMTRVQQQETLSYIESGKFSLMATSRPLLGRYNPYQTLSRNINIPAGLQSLFDLIFLIRDTPEREYDRLKAERFLGLNDCASDPPISFPKLQAYLESCKTIKPVLSDEAKQVLRDFYLEIRELCSCEDATTITIKQLKTMRKIAEAHAKLHQRETVWAGDAEAAVAMLTHSLEQIGIDPVKKSYDIDVLYTGRPTVLNSKLLKVVDAFSELEKISEEVKQRDLESLLWERFGMTHRMVSRLLRTLVDERIIRMSSPGIYKRTKWD